MLSVNSLSDEPDDIFKLFEYHQAVCRFQEHHGESSDTRCHINEIVLDPEEGFEIMEDQELLESAPEEDAVCEFHHGESSPAPGSLSIKEENLELDEEILDRCLHVLGGELIPDEELCKLPPDALKQVFPFFMKNNFQMPDIDDTPLGDLLLKKKQEQIEDLTTYELEQMLNFTQKENAILQIQNEVFQRFLKKNDPRFDEEFVKTMEINRDVSLAEASSLDICSAEMTKSKVVFPDVEDYESDNIFMSVLSLYTTVVDHEIREVHKEYEKDLNKFTAKMKDISAVQNSLKIHRDKMTETLHLLNTLIVKKNKRKLSFDLLQFAEFLKATIKQDQQDVRRLRVLTYKYNKKISSIQTNFKYHDRVRIVDLELYELKSKELTTKLSEQNEEFLQLKKIFDSYQRRLDSSIKKLEELRRTRIRDTKTFWKKTKDLEVQQTCYKMALDSLMELIDSIVLLGSTTSPIPAISAIPETN